MVRPRRINPLSPHCLKITLTYSHVSHIFSIMVLFHGLVLQCALQSSDHEFQSRSKLDFFPGFYVDCRQSLGREKGERGKCTRTRETPRKQEESAKVFLASRILRVQCLRHCNTKKNVRCAFCWLVCLAPKLGMIHILGQLFFDYLSHDFCGVSQ